MPILVELIRENRVVLQTYTDPLDSTHILQLKNKMDGEIFPATTRKLHIIANFSGVRNLPGTILINGSSMLVRAHPNTGHIICVTPSSFIRSMAQIFSSLSPKQSFKIVKNLDEAYAEVDLLLAQGL